MPHLQADGESDAPGAEPSDDATDVDSKASEARHLQEVAEAGLDDLFRPADSVFSRVQMRPVATKMPTSVVVA